MITLISIILIFTGATFWSLLYIISVQPAAMALRTGDKAYKTCTRIRYVSGIFQAIAVAGYILFIFGDIYNYPILNNNTYIIRIAGILFSALTIGFMFIGAKAAGKETMNPGKETRLYGGIYDHMRHPQALGEMLSWFGFAMILNSLSLLLFSIIWMPIFISFTIIEDNDLAVRFGEPFIRYTQKTGVFWRKRIN